MRPDQEKAGHWNQRLAVWWSEEWRAAVFSTPQGKYRNSSECMRSTKNDFRRQTPLPVSGPWGDVLCRSAQWEDLTGAPTLTDSGPGKFCSSLSPSGETETRMPT